MENQYERYHDAINNAKKQNPQQTTQQLLNTIMKNTKGTLNPTLLKTLLNTQQPTKPGWWWTKDIHQETQPRQIIYSEKHGLYTVTNTGKMLKPEETPYTWICPIPTPEEIQNQTK